MAGNVSEDLTAAGREYIRAYSWLKNHNLLPWPGTWIEQSAVVVDAIDFINRIAGAWQRCIDRKNEAARAIAASMGVR